MSNQINKPSKTKQNVLIAGALVSALLIGGGAAIAGGKDCTDGEGRQGKWAEKGEKHAEKRLHRMSKKLELNDEQKAQVGAIMEANRDKMQQQREANRAEFKSEISQVLSEEQMAKFAEMMNGRGDKHHKGKRGDKDMKSEAAES